MKVATLFTGLGGLDLGCARATSRAFDSTTAHFQQHPNSVSDCARGPSGASNRADLPRFPDRTPATGCNKPDTRLFSRWSTTSAAPRCCARSFPARALTVIFTRSANFPPKRRCSRPRSTGPRRATTTTRSARRSSRAGCPPPAPPRSKSTRRFSGSSPRGRLLGRPRASRLASSVGHRRGSRCAPKLSRRARGSVAALARGDPRASARDPLRRIFLFSRPLANAPTAARGLRL